MARNIKSTVAKGDNTNENHHVKHYRESSFVAKKTQEAKETLQKFPVPEKYSK